MTRTGIVTARITAVIEVDRDEVDEHRERDRGREHEGGEIAREICLERVDALDRGGGELAGALVGGAPGAVDQQAVHEPLA